jgi:NAD(P)-dependent dehydrogenase (short-subunit alcohol dehydrogenase family)
MGNIAAVTGADRGLGLALTAALLEEGWQVFAGQYMPDWPELGELLANYSQQLKIVPLDVASQEAVQEMARLIGGDVERVDLLINNAGINADTRERTLRQEPDHEEMMYLYNVNALGPLRVVEALLPLMDQGEGKRLCFVSSEAGSIARSKRKAWYSYCMSKAALNMGVKNLFNLLRPEGYTFRLYHPGWMRSYIGGSKGTEAPLEPEEAAVPALAHFLEQYADPAAEDRLAMKDWRGEEWPW